MVSIKQVVRGVEEKNCLWNWEGNSGWSATECKDYGIAVGYNSLALTEVVVDREKIAKMIKAMAYVDDDVAFDPTNKYINDIADAIATAIESGSIISLKEK